MDRNFIKLWLGVIAVTIWVVAIINLITTLYCNEHDCDKFTSVVRKVSGTAEMPIGISSGETNPAGAGFSSIEKKP